MGFGEGREKRKKRKKVKERCRICPLNTSTPLGKPTSSADRLTKKKREEKEKKKRRKRFARL